MALNWLIALIILALIAYIAFKIFKKIVKTIITVVAVVFIVSFVFIFIVKLDANELSESLETGVVVLYEDKLGFETNPYKIISEENLGQEYKELIGNKTKIIIYKTGALEGIDEDIFSRISTGNYTKNVEEFKKVFEENNTLLFLLRQFKKGNVDIYPKSPLLTFAKSSPDFILKMVVKNGDKNGNT